MGGRLRIAAASPAAARYLHETWHLDEVAEEGVRLCEIEMGGNGRFDPLWERLELGGQLLLPAGTRLTEILPVWSLLALHAGALPLHASAFALGGHGIVYAGPAHSGKTGALLAAAAAGAHVIGDECVWLADDHRSLRGFPLPLEVRLRYVRELPGYVPVLPAARLWVARLYGLLARVSGPVEALRRRFEGRARLFVEPQRLFEGCSQSLNGRCDHLFLSRRGNDGMYEVREASPSEAASALADIVVKEFEALIKRHPNAPLLAEARRAAQYAIEGALDGKRVHVLSHPYPTEARRLLAAMRTVL